MKYIDVKNLFKVSKILYLWNNINIQYIQILVIKKKHIFTIPNFRLVPIGYINKYI